jgi:hypothetical protein
MRILSRANTLPALFAAALIGTAATTWALPPRAQTLCPAGTRVCSGSFGSTCYSPTANMVCMNGVVCAAGQQACAGPYGASCYAPARGQQCLQGVVCNIGESICDTGGVPQCYNPARGATCR